MPTWPFSRRRSTSTGTGPSAAQSRAPEIQPSPQLPASDVTIGELVADIAALTDPEDDALKIALLQEAIQRAEAGEANEVQRALLQAELGETLTTYALDNPGETLERAIAVYEQALTVQALQAMPDSRWARAQNNLGALYCQRRAGDRAENLEHAIAALEQAVTGYLSEGMLVDAASTQYNLGQAYRDRIRGDRAENLEHAIAALEQAATIRTQKTLPREWASTQLSLGNAYSERIRGDRALNLEVAIQAFEKALTVYTRETRPVQWAAVQIYLGNAYNARVGGDNAENVERAIQAYEQALTVYTYETAPDNWAVTQMNLGGAYTERVDGDRAENLERALAAFEQALQVYARETQPVEWAMTQYNMGLAYSRRVDGDWAENVERALAAFEAALTVRTREARPLEWAMTQTSLGDAYTLRVDGDRAENLERALAAFEAALTVRTREAWPIQFHDTILALARVRETQGRWEDAHRAYLAARAVQRDLIALAEDARSRAVWIAKSSDIDVYLHDAQCLVHLGASTLTSSGAAGEDSPLIAAAEALEEGRAQALRAELEADALDPASLADPAARARLQAYIDARDTWRRAQHGEKLSDVLAHPLVKDVLASNPSVGDVLDAVGDAADEQHEMQRKAVHEARLVVDRALDAIRTHDNPDFLTPVVRLSALATRLAAAGIGRDEVLVYVVASDEGGFALTVSFDPANPAGPAVPFRVPLPHLTEAAVMSLIETRSSAPAGAHGPGEADRSTSSNGETVRRNGGLIQAQEGWAFGNLKEWGVSAREAVAALPPSCGFARALRRLEETWSSHGAPSGSSSRELAQRLALFETPFAELNERQQATFAAAFHDVLLRLELERSLTALGELGVSQLAAYLHAQGIKRVALVPYGMLALFPLPAVQVAAQGDEEGRSSVPSPSPSHEQPICLGDLFEVTLAPSASAYAAARTRAAAADAERHASDSKRTRPTVLAVGNPLPLPFGKRTDTTYNGSLPYAAAEADGLHTIAARFAYPPDEVVVYAGTQAQRARVLAGLADAWYAHLALHAQFDPNRPRDSHLVLAGDETMFEEERELTLGECLEGTVRLEGVRLLVLSACETSLIDVNRAPNEMVGMAAGFLQAGAAAVIASLWPVADRATFLLMTRFMQLWLDPARRWSPARCLAEAQRWLREEATNAVIATYDPARPISSHRGNAAGATISPSSSEAGIQPAAETETATGAVGELGARAELAELAVEGTRTLRYTQATALERLRTTAEGQGDPDGLPYAHPIFWAAFTVTGA